VDFRPEPKTLEIARLHINRLRMEDLAYRHVYKGAIFHPQRVALVTIARELQIGQCVSHPETLRPMVDQSIVLDAVAKVQNPPSARNTALEQVSIALHLVHMFSLLTTDEIRSRWPRTNPQYSNLKISRSKSYLYFTDVQWQNFRNLTELFRAIDLVVADQAADPECDEAGVDKVPHSVYFNMSASLRL
jgi:hypothetical protein